MASILKLESFYGLPDKIRSIGPAAHGVAERLAKAHAKAEANRQRAYGPFVPNPMLFGSVVPSAYLELTGDFELGSEPTVFVSMSSIRNWYQI